MQTLRLLSLCLSLFVDWLLSMMQYYGLKYWRLWIMCIIFGFLTSLFLSVYTFVISLPMFFGSAAPTSPLSALCLSACAWFFVRPPLDASPALALALDSGAASSSTVASPGVSKLLLATSPGLAYLGRLCVQHGSRLAIAVVARLLS